MYQIYYNLQIIYNTDNTLKEFPIVRPRWENLGKTVWPQAAKRFTQLKAWGWVWKFWGKKPAIIMTEEITTSKTGLGKVVELYSCSLS